MREIKFRGKRVDNGAWETGSLVIERMYTSEASYYIADKMTAYHTPVIPETVGQFTGFIDKNRKEIYVSDIIELINEAGNKILVTCGFGHAHRELNGILCDIVGFYFILPNGKKSFPICENYIGKHDTEIFEVVGNVYDNSDLIINH